MLKTQKILAALIVSVVVGQSAFAVTFQNKIEQIIARKEQQKVEFSITVVDPQTGQVVYGHNSTKPLTPASNMKLLTSFAAFKQLGPDYKFTTRAGLCGNKLVIIGGGDPLLGLDGRDFVSQITDAVKTRNITQLDGIIVDSSIFDDVPVNENWPKAQLNRSYACEIAGLNYNGNCVKISAFTKNGQVTLTKEPNTEFLTLLNSVKASSKENAIGSNRTDQKNTIVVYGKCAKSASFDVAIENPSLFMGRLVCESLTKAGVSIANGPRQEVVNPADVEVIAVFETPIIEVLHNCNKDSMQIAAECMVKMLAAKTSGQAGSWQGARIALGNYLSSLGIDKAEFYIDDGSGLSNVNKLSSNVLVKVLLDAYQDKNWPLFKETLAIGGVDGTIKKQFYKDKHKNKVYAKTGYINGVRALSGVCSAMNGKEYIFSILANKANYSTKTAIANIVESILDEN